LDSGLINILASAAFIVVVLMILYLINLIYRSNKTRHELQRVKNLRIFEVSIPKQVTQAQTKPNEPPKDFREVMSVADQFFSSLSQLYEKSLQKSIYRIDTQISMEIVAIEGRIEFYCVCPAEIETIVEKQINSFWPTAHVKKTLFPDIFQAENAQMSVCNFRQTKKFVLPIKTYKYLEADPLNAMTNALSKLSPGSATAIQVIVKPINDDWRRAVGLASFKVQEGKSVEAQKWYMKVTNFLFDLLSGVFHGAKSNNPNKNIAGDIKQPVQLTPMQEQTMKFLNEKASKTGLATNIRIVTVAPTAEEATLNLKNITTAFGQYSTPELNGFKAKTDDSRAVKDYILRRFTGKGMILNSEELASIFHFPSHYVETPNIEWLMAKEMPPPTNLPQDGVVLGESIYRGEKKPVRIRLDDRRRHIFMIGKTGVGKTTLYTNIIEQDMTEGRGCCFIDPLGDAIEDLLGKVPENRLDDVILFDPSDTDYPMGLNLLEWHTLDEKDFLIQEAIQIFYKLFDPGQTGIVGPQWEHWFRNAALTIMAQPGGGTLIDVPRIFTDDTFRSHLLTFVQDPIVKAFWEQQLAKTADFHKSEMYNYFISKFGRFTTNELMRNIIGQKKSAFDLRKAMDEGKIILINLSKGKIGEVNSNLLGMILVSKIQMAAFSRADTPEPERKDFYLFVDEFQNFTTDSFATILSEARKYRLNLAVANQYIAQLIEKIRDAVIGNVGTMICYRIGAADAEFMVKEFPGASIDDLANLDKFNTYTKLLIDGTPSKPFSMKNLKSAVPSSAEIREKVKTLSRKLARPKAEVDAEIKEGIMAMAAPGNNNPPAGSNEPIKNL